MGVGHSGWTGVCSSQGSTAPLDLKSEPQEFPLRATTEAHPWSEPFVSLPLLSQRRGEQEQAVGTEILLPSPRDHAPRTDKGVTLNVASSQKQFPNPHSWTWVDRIPMSLLGNINYESQTKQNSWLPADWRGAVWDWGALNLT